LAGVRIPNEIGGDDSDQMMEALMQLFDAYGLPVEEGHPNLLTALVGHSVPPGDEFKIALRIAPQIWSGMATAIVGGHPFPKEFASANLDTVITMINQLVQKYGLGPPWK
jgi:hypothetical protein